MLYKELTNTLRLEVEKAETIVKSDRLSEGFSVAGKAVVFAAPLVAASMPAATPFVPIVSSLLTAVGTAFSKRREAVA